MSNISANASVKKEDSKERSFKVIFDENMAIITKQTGIDAKIIVAVLGVCLFFTLIGYFDIYITNAVGIMYPAYWSMKAIESKETDDDKQWLTYWVCFALFSMVDLFSGFILKFVPFYFFFKLLFLVFLMAPNLKGAIIVYDNFLKKLFKKYEKQLDGLADRLGDKVSSAYDKGRSYVKENQADLISGGVAATSKVLETTSKDK